MFNLNGAIKIVTLVASVITGISSSVSLARQADALNQQRKKKKQKQNPEGEAA